MLITSELNSIVNLYFARATKLQFKKKHIMFQSIYFVKKKYWKSQKHESWKTTLGTLTDFIKRIKSSLSKVNNYIKKRDSY